MKSRPSMAIAAWDKPLRMLGCIVGASLLLLSAVAARADAPPPVLLGKIEAHPALWTVRSRNATAYLFGSIHLLPPNMEWHSPQIDAALHRADTFIFEAPLDAGGKSDASDFVRMYGTLPPDVALPSLLDAQGRKDYSAALAITHVSPDRLVHMQPWLAAIVLEAALMEQEHYAPSAGVDRQIYAFAKSEGKSIGSFETIDQQLALLMPRDRKLGIAEFVVSLKQLQTEANKLGPLVDAWADGQVGKVGSLLNADLAAVPGAEKMFIDDRNVAWLAKIKTMLSQRHTYFITVGAGHLSGPHGLPALLRAQGFRVERS